MSLPFRKKREKPRHQIIKYVNDFRNLGKKKPPVKSYSPSSSKNCKYLEDIINLEKNIILDFYLESLIFFLQRGMGRKLWPGSSITLGQIFIIVIPWWASG